MMKKVLSVALSVIMVLGLICVPSFAEEPATTVEYTVSNVSYAGEVYDELNPAADANGYAMVDGITSVPDNGKKLVPSVEISASAETTATVIFAVYTENVLTNAFYETKAVGTTAVEFSKEITVADNTKETYKVFVLGADGKAIAPVSSFPTAENAMEYIVISYADGTEDKYFGADLEGTTLVSAISDARKVANPSIKVVPVDNTTVVTIDIDADFWTNGATVELKALDGTTVTYTIMSDMIKAGFTPVLGKIYQYQGATLTKTIKTYEKQYASFESTAEVVNVTVPYGTASLTLDPITIYENGVPKKSSAEEISMDGAAEKEYMVSVGSKEYKFVFKWDDSAPYITGVKFGGGYAARSIVLRADGASAIGYSNSTDISKTPESATITGQLAGTGANTDLTVNGVAIPNNSDFTILALAREDNFVRTDMVSYTNNNWAHMTENEAWTSFKISEPATVYVKMSHANAGEADFVWKEGATAGWTKATSSNKGTIYYKTFAAGETVNVPSQVVTEEELAFVNAKLETAYPATGEVQFKYVLADHGAVLNYSSDGKAYDDASKTWEAHPTGKNTKSEGAKLAMADGKYYKGLYYRNAGSATGLTVSYGSPLFIAVAFNNVPGEGGATPEVPPVDPEDPEDPDEPAAPTLSYTTKLALTGAPKTTKVLDAFSEANNYGDTGSVYGGGIYKVAVQSDSIELNPEDTTVDIEVAYGTEAIVLNDTTTIDLLTNNGTGNAVVNVDGVDYTVNVSWKAFAAADMSADAPLLYNLKYYVADKTNLVAGTYYNLMPTTMKLDAATDWVYGEGDLVKTEDSSVMYAEGSWITVNSHCSANFLATNNGGGLARLHLAGESFKSFAEKGYTTDRYALNGATLLVAHYQDTKAATVVSPRYTFNSAVKGYVIAAFTNENAALTADGWTLLADAKIVTSNRCNSTQRAAVGIDFALPATAYEYVYVKAVNVGTEVSIKEAAGANNNDCNPVVLVATEDMLNVDLEAPVEPEIPPVDPEDPPVVEPTTKLASITYSTAAHLRHTEAATETDATQAWQVDATEYVVKVPIGTGTVTVTAAADDAATPNTLASDVVVDMAGKDEATAEILGFTVKFVWDDTDPYISDVKLAIGFGGKEGFRGRWGVDYGADGDLTYQASGTNDSGALSTKALSDLALEGETAPAATKYVYSIATHSLNGQAHMSSTFFQMRDGTYEGTNAENSLMSFKVSAPATVYAKAVALDYQWEELVAAGWTEAGTLNGAKLYKKEYAAGDYVYLPGTTPDDDEIAAYNARKTTDKYIKYVPTEEVVTKAGTVTQAAAFAGYTEVQEGNYYNWTLEEGVLDAPAKHTSGAAMTVLRPADKTGFDPVFYVQFAEPAAPEVPTLTSVSYTTEVLAQYVDATAVTETATETFTEAAAEYVVKVPVGTKKVTVTAAADNQEGTLATSVEVDLAGADAKSVEILGYTVKFVWDDTERPYIYNFNFAGAFSKRANVQFGDSAPTVNADKPEADYAAIGSELTSLAFADGLTTPTADKNLVVIGAGQALVGTGHQKNANFPWVFGDFPANDASDAALSFNMGQDGTVYLATTARDNEWEELEAKGFTKVGTAAGKTVFSKAFSAGDLVLVPNPKYGEDEAAAQSAALTNQKIAKTTEENQSLFAAATPAITNDIAIGDWVYWNTDEEGNIISAVNAAGSKTAHPQHPTQDKNGIAFFVVFGDAQPTDPVEPEQPETPEVPEQPETPDNSANQLDLTYTTALAVTEPKATSNHANGKNRVQDVKSIYAGGFYMPTLVETATAAVVDHEEKTAVVTVPFGTEVVNLNAATVAGTGIDLADNATVAMLNDNGVAKTFDVVAGENTYAVTVKWADAADATMGLASTGADVYGVKYKYNDLWAGSTLAYKLIPTKLDMSVDFTVDASQYAEGEAPTELADGVYYNGNMLFYANMTAMASTTDYKDLARYKLGASSFNNWVVNAIIENVADLNNATLVNTGVYYETSKSDPVGANAAMDSYLTFNVEADGVVYVIPSNKGTFTNDDTWTEVEAVTLAASRGGTSTAGYTFQIEAYDDVVFIKNVVAGEEVTVPVAVSSGTYNPIVIYDAGASYTAPPTPEVPEEEVQPLGDIEDGGMEVLADTEDTLGATQDAASTDVTVEGNKGEDARGEHVVVMVLAEGKTLADVQAALATPGSGDLVAAGIVLGMGSATVDENGDYTVDMTLPNSVTSGSYDVVIGDETVEDALEYTAIAEKVAAYNAIVTGAADPFADVDLIISTNDIYTGLTPAGQAAVEASVLAKDSVAALPVITEPTPGEYVGLENIALLAAIIDTRVAVEALNEGVDAAELALVWDYILPEADAESADIAAVAAAIYEDATALNATGKANVVAAISEKDYETETVEGVQVSVKDQVQADFAEAAFVELINNTNYSNINNVAAFVNDYIAADVFENLTSVSTTTLSTIVRDYTITSYADFEEKVAAIVGGGETTTPGGTEVVVPGTNTGTTTGGMSNSNTGTSDPDPVPAKKKLSDFVDANEAAWAATALQMMLDREILTGYEDNTIRPNNNATRQEVAKMLVEAFSEVRVGAWTGFADVPADSWYYSYVATAQEDGIIKGVSATAFGTDALITREDLSVLIYRFLTNKGIVMTTNANRAFTDASLMSDYAVDAINALANAGIVNGYEDGSYNPKGYATRAEIAQVIANVINHYAL